MALVVSWLVGWLVRQMQKLRCCASLRWTERTVQCDIFWSECRTIHIYCTMFRYLDRFWPPIVRVSPLKTPFCLVLGFIYNHTLVVTTLLYTNTRQFSNLSVIVFITHFKQLFFTCGLPVTVSYGKLGWWVDMSHYIRVYSKRLQQETMLFVLVRSLDRYPELLSYLFLVGLWKFRIDISQLFITSLCFNPYCLLIATSHTTLHT
jgi:hypothetical protein